MKNNFEKIIAEALRLKENGKSLPEIFNLFPNNRQELEDVFKAIDFLSFSKEKVLPRPELLTEIISKVSSESKVGAVKESNKILLANLFSEIFSFKRWKIFVSAGAVVVLAVIFIYSRVGVKSPLELASNDVVNSTLASISVEDSVVANENADASTLTTDNQEIDSLLKQMDSYGQN